MLDSLFRFLGRSGRPAARVKSKPSAVPNLEALEERWVLSTANSMSTQALLGSAIGDLTSTPPAGIVQTTNTGGVQVIDPGATAPSVNNGAAPTPVANTPSNASATQTREVDATFAAFPTGSSATQTIAQFNPSLGTLTGIQIITNGTLTSDVKVENLDEAPSNVSAQVNGSLSVQGPGFNPLTVTPSLSENTTLSASDGGTSFGGTAGHDFGAQSAQASKAVNLSASENDLSAWIGSGSVSLTETAQSSSTLSGSGNVMSQINTTAGGSVKVIYSYTPPAPSTPPPTTPPPTTPPPPPPGGCTTPTGPGSLSGIVYADPNHSGQYVTSDPGVPGVTVNLSGVTVTGQSVSQTTQTASDGSYRFSDLQPGMYALSDVTPPNFTAGVENLGSLGGTIENNQMIVALPQGGNGMCYDFGEVPPPPPASPPPPSNNGGGVPITPPPPPASPPPNTPSDPPAATSPIVLSKRWLIGDGWQSLG